MPGGIRLLLDLGDLETGEARTMRFTTQGGEVLLELQDALVGMDEAAAGSGGLGNLLHGRYGRAGRLGATLSFDLALPSLTKQLGQGLPRRGGAMRFFVPQDKTPRGVASRVQGRRGSRYGDSKPSYDASAAARAAAAAAELEQLGYQPGEALPEHCYVCLALTVSPPPRFQTGRKRYWEFLTVSGVRRRVCSACSRQVPIAMPARQPPAVQFCTSGCAGCTSS